MHPLPPPPPPLAIDPLYIRLAMITRGLHDMLGALRVGLDAEHGGMQAALQRHQPDGVPALLAGRVLSQLERTEQDLLRLLTDCTSKGGLADSASTSTSRRCLDELLASTRA